MSHFSTIKTKLTDRRHLLRALREMGFRPEEGPLPVRGYRGARTMADIRIASKAPGYDVGFLKNGPHYVCVADWFGVQGIEQKTFIQSLTQRYSVAAVKEELAEQGFSIAEEKKVEGCVHLVLRRMG